MPKLLDWVKEKDIPHDELMEFIEKNYKPDWRDQKEQILDDKKKEIDKPEIKEELKQLKKDEKKIPDDKKELKNENYKLEFSEDEVKQLVAAEIAKQLKIKRADPSKGEVSDKPIEQAVIQKNLFEKIV